MLRQLNALSVNKMIFFKNDFKFNCAVNFTGLLSAEKRETKQKIREFKKKNNEKEQQRKSKVKSCNFHHFLPAVLI